MFLLAVVNFLLFAPGHRHTCRDYCCPLFTRYAQHTDGDEEKRREKRGRIVGNKKATCDDEIRGITKSMAVVIIITRHVMIISRAVINNPLLLLFYLSPTWRGNHELSRAILSTITRVKGEVTRHGRLIRTYIVISWPFNHIPPMSTTIGGGATEGSSPWRQDRLKKEECGERGATCVWVKHKFFHPEITFGLPAYIVVQVVGAYLNKKCVGTESPSRYPISSSRARVAIIRFASILSNKNCSSRFQPSKLNAFTVVLIQK